MFLVFFRKNAHSRRFGGDMPSVLTAFPLDESLFLCYIRTVCLKPRAAGQEAARENPVFSGEKPHDDV